MEKSSTLTLKLLKIMEEEALDACLLKYFELSHDSIYVNKEKI